MNNALVYEPVDEANYKRTVTALELEIDRLKSQLLSTEGLSVIERDKQQIIWLELDRITQHLVRLRDTTIDVIHVK